VLTTLASSGGLSAVGAVITALTAIVTALAALAASAQATVLRRRLRRELPEELQQAEPTLEGRLDELKDLTGRLSRLTVQVTTELGAREATAQRLRKEAEDAEALAALHQDQADAVRRMIDAELATSRRDIRRDSIRIGIASFIAGAAASLLVTLLVHPIH
jgi:C4-dicarboxylate-specific signal transduction histidine kinase